ncbi:glycine cleavage system protein GcvH [Streptomyces sp. NK15101]|uniref:glycine cleavage system protein GcvH n=1 Tax=Streptomyces sp. NK15101 TaxID=2873261 RepID=UPI001CED145A|nr:glycine cleavage system protein GcvH [Streptomyces sp. NK15101]
MSYCPEHLKYTKDHEWVEKTGDRRVRVGITDFAQKQLGDIVFVDVPSVNRAVDAGEPLGIVESVKSVSELYAPVSGRVTAKNPELDSDPELVNTDSYGDGWIAEIEIAGTGALDGLLDAAQYQEYLAAE